MYQERWSWENFLPWAPAILIPFLCELICLNFCMRLTIRRPAFRDILVKTISCEHQRFFNDAAATAPIHSRFSASCWPLAKVAKYLLHYLLFFPRDRHLGLSKSCPHLGLQSSWRNASTVRSTKSRLLVMSFGAAPLIVEQLSITTSCQKWHAKSFL